MVSHVLYIHVNHTCLLGESQFVLIVRMYVPKLAMIVIEVDFTICYFIFRRKKKSYVINNYSSAADRQPYQEKYNN